MKHVERLLKSIFNLVFALVFVKIVMTWAHGEFDFTNFIKLIIIFMIFLNSWTIEVVHLNRYAKSKVRNYIFMFFQMLIYLLIFTKDDYSLRYLLASLILVAVIFSLQHIIEYISIAKDDLILKKLTEPFCYIHTIRTFTLMLGFIFLDYAYLFIFIAFLISQLFPSFISRSLHALSLDFKDLVFNIASLVTILTTIIFIYNIFYSSYLSSAIVVLFLVYYIFLVSIVDKTLVRQSGNTFILGSYFIIFSLFNIEYIFINEVQAIYIFTIILGLTLGYSTYKQYKKSD